MKPHIWKFESIPKLRAPAPKFVHADGPFKSAGAV
jgi:hypothetical protein